MSTFAGLYCPVTILVTDITNPDNLACDLFTLKVDCDI